MPKLFLWRWGCGLRIGSHYWLARFTKRGPIWSERNRVRCVWWQVGSFRFTYRWDMSV